MTAKLILLTGGGFGIGRTTAQTLAADGYVALEADLIALTQSNRGTITLGDDEGRN